MSDKEKPAVATLPTPPAAVGAAVPPTIPPKRSPGHRGADVKDTVAEMAAKAHEISLEAGSKMAAAMKDVVGAAAGLTCFVLESARDLLQYMVRRGQMTQEEADKLMREVEASHAKRRPFTPPTPPPVKAAPKMEAPHEVAPRHPAPPVVKHAAPAPVKHSPAKKPAAKKPSMKPSAKKHPVKAGAKPKPKGSGKSAKRR
jgi:polyhydroxyalkanoate synthesis regulator phasin